MTEESPPQYKIKTTATVFTIIEILKEHNGATVTEVANETELSIGAVHNHLRTLLELGHIIREGKTYYIGLKFLEYGVHALNRHEVVDIARGPLSNLAEDTGEIVWLATEDHGETVGLEKKIGERGVQTDGYVGNRSPMHRTANGKAIMADLPRSRVEEIIDQHHLLKTTEKTITNSEELFDELEEIRSRGYAVNDEESVAGTRSIGCTIRNKNRIYGAVSISGPVRRMGHDRIKDKLVDDLMGCVEEIALRIKYESTSGE